MKQLNSRSIIYFALGLLVGVSPSYLFELNDKYSSELEIWQLDQLLNLLLHLTIGGVLLGTLIILLSRGLALVFLDETKHAKWPNCKRN